MGKGGSGMRWAIRVVEKGETMWVARDGSPVESKKAAKIFRNRLDALAVLYRLQAAGLEAERVLV